MTRPCTFFMLLKATTHWRALDEAARLAVFDHTLALVFNGFPDLRMTHFAAGAFHGRCSDVIVWETTEVSQYQAAIEALGDEPFFGVPLFEVVDVIAGMNTDVDEEHEAVLGLPMRHLAFEGPAPHATQAERCMAERSANQSAA